MTKMKMLLSVIGILCLASPAMAGGWVRPWYGAAPQGWACGAYEYAKRCNAGVEHSHPSLRLHRKIDALPQSAARVAPGKDLQVPGVTSCPTVRHLTSPGRSGSQTDVANFKDEELPASARRLARRAMLGVAGVEGLEPPTPGFGDRCSSH